MERALFKGGNETTKVPWIGNQREVRAPAHCQQRQSERKDVIQRQGGDAVDFPDVVYALKGGSEPGLRLQHCGHDVAVRQHGALAQSGSAAGVLQKRNRVETAGGGLEGQRRAERNNLLERSGGLFLCQRQLVSRYQHGQMSDRKSET